MADRIVANGLWPRFRRQAAAMTALMVLALLILLVICGPLIWRIDPHFIDSDPVRMIGLRNQAPSLAHPLGTDQLGRDMLARLMLGGQVSLAVGLVAMLVALGIGTGIGLLAGYFRRLDGWLMRLTDIFLSLPVLPLMLVMMFLFRDALGRWIGPGAGSFALIVLAIGLTGWMPAARLVRAEVLSLRERDFIRAARAIGAPAPRILRHHILPNVWAPVLVAASLGISSAILTESMLSFLGFGFPPDMPTWGRLLHEGVGAMRSHPDRLVWPGLALTLTLLCVTYIGEGLRRALDPRQH
ncbi:ABC transporter permease [Gemmobacter serpentinus]|uniref:ABC transporter permease n=1 Tax=Gemmobacter serpentinus TaxID=2652247 RepID=UPI001CF6A687|nr:ABC transporter permease [Gemmobacter serpentinus]